MIRYGESIWPGTSPRQTELNVRNLEPDLLAQEGGWVAKRPSCRTQWSESDKACQCFLFNILICISLINPQGWFLQFRWNVNSLLHSSSSGAPAIVSGIPQNETNADGFVVLLRKYLIHYAIYPFFGGVGGGARGRGEGAGNSLRNFTEYLSKAHTAGYGGEAADTVLCLIWPENEQTKHYPLRMQNTPWNTMWRTMSLNVRLYTVNTFLDYAFFLYYFIYVFYFLVFFSLGLLAYFC